jgi:hypothetical protein
MVCTAGWLATDVDAAEELGSHHCGLHWYRTSIAARNTRGQQNSQNFLADSSELPRRWFIALT